MDDQDLMNALKGGGPSASKTPPPDPEAPLRRKGARGAKIVLVVALVLLLVVPVVGFFVYTPLEDDLLELLLGAPALGGP